MSTSKITGWLKTIRDDQRGITGLETAIILIAFIVVAAVFAFTIMTTGLFSTEKAKTTAQAGIQQVSSTFTHKGSVTAEGDPAATPSFVSKIIFQIATASGAETGSIDPNDIAVVYIDENQRHAASLSETSSTKILKSTTISKITGDASLPNLLQNTELAEISIELNGDITDPSDATVKTSTALRANTTFRIELLPSSGGTLLIERETPPNIKKVMNLM